MAGQPIWRLQSTNADWIRIMRRLISTALILLACSACDSTIPPSASVDTDQAQQSPVQVSPDRPPPPSPSSNFKRVNLPRGVSLDVPKGWWVLDDEFTQMLHTSTEAVLDLSGMPLNEGTEVDLLRANSMPRSTYASVAVTSTVPPSGQPDELRAIRSDELSELARYLSAVMQDGFSKQGWQLLDAVSVRVRSVSGCPALITDYRRTGVNGPVSGQVIQVMTEQQEVKIVLSYRDSEAAIWGPVIEKIRRSISVKDHCN